MLIANNLYKTFALKSKISFFKNRDINEKNAVNNLSLKVEPGKIVGLLGINGAGKTTTIKMLTTMLSPTKGEISIDNIDAIKNPLEAKEKINLISGGERNLYWRLTAEENLEYFGSLYGLKSSELKNRIKKILEVVDLVDVKNIPVEKYSKGMKQRLQIARGLINDPSYLFLDEPTLGLDVVIAKEFRKYIKRLASVENKGILLTSHYISEVEELCDYIYFLKEGSLYFQGTSQEIKQMFLIHSKVTISGDNFSADFLEEIKNLKSVSEIVSSDENKSVTVIANSKYITNELIELSQKFKINLSNMALKEASLEDAIFSAIERNQN
ncbi:ABC-2 type transport system ATP-binding protein [Enterococcus sp. DIV0724b]|uniref:ABC transporter ATP-binding protein n=1 Tax=Enterococcus sp. DIV0724b TaxID=2774694 RepID=UPI003D2FC355